MTLGCGGYGGNITSDNISPRHLLNIKRLAYETSPAPSRRDAEPRRQRLRCRRRRRTARTGWDRRRTARPTDRPVPGVAGLYAAAGDRAAGDGPRLQPMRRKRSPAGSRLPLRLQAPTPGRR